MRHETFRLAGVGGLALHAESWLPDRPPRANVLLVHGLAEHCGRYGELVGRLVARGCAVHALDHRGHGRSDGPRAYVERFDWLLQDLDRLYGQVRTAAVAAVPGAPPAAPGETVPMGAAAPVPTWVIGHSMGGAIAFAWALRHPERVQRLVLSAPLLATDPGAARLQLAAATVLSRLAPRVGALKLPSDTISRDPVVVRAYDADPLIHRGAIPARTLVELVDATAGFAAAAPTLRVPVLVLHGTGDRLVPLAHCRPVYERLDARRRTLKIYQDLYHELFNEPERLQVYADVEAWLETPLA